MLAVAAMLAYAGPPVPLAETIVSEPILDGGVREEINALRREIREERVRHLQLLKELRQQHSTHIDLPVQTPGVGSIAIVEHNAVVQDVVAVGNDVRVYGTVRGNATALGGNVVLYSTAIVHGDAISVGGQVVLKPGAKLYGDRIGMQATSSSLNLEIEQSWGSFLFQHLMTLLSLAGGGILVVGLFPRRVASVAQTLERSPLTSAIIGSVFTVFAIVFSLVFLVVTLGIGIPISAIVLCILCAAWGLGFVGVCQAVGDRLPMATPNGRWGTLVAGAFLFAFMGSFGAPGLLFAFLISMAGIGATISSRFGA